MTQRELIYLKFSLTRFGLSRVYCIMNGKIVHQSLVRPEFNLLTLSTLTLLFDLRVNHCSKLWSVINRWWLIWDTSWPARLASPPLIPKYLRVLCFFLHPRLFFTPSLFLFMLLIVDSRPLVPAQFQNLKHPHLSFSVPSVWRCQPRLCVYLSSNLMALHCCPSPCCVLAPSTL